MPNAINDAEKRKDIYLFRGKFIEDMQESASASCLGTEQPPHPPTHPALKQIWPPSGEMLASNKTVTVGKHFTLFLKTTTLQG